MNAPLKTSLSEIPEFTKKFAKTLGGGEIIALIGQLGSGKTTFVKALAKNLTVLDPVTSPTFVIMNRYQGMLKNYGLKKIFIFHLDLYRTKNAAEVKALGLEDFWKRPDTITLIEWADKFPSLLPKNTISIYFSPPKP